MSSKVTPEGDNDSFDEGKHARKEILDMYKQQEEEQEKIQQQDELKSGKTKRVKVLKKTKDETPEQRDERKSQERRRRQTKERREKSQKEQQPVALLKEGVQNKTLAEGLEKKEKKEKVVIKLSKDEWTFLISDMYLVNYMHIPCVKIMSEETDSMNLIQHFKKIETRSAKREEEETLQVSPFAEIPWFSVLFDKLLTLDNTEKKVHYKRACAFSCTHSNYLELTDQECEGLANGLQVQLRKCVRIQTAYDNWLEIFPCMKKLDKEQEWMRPLCMVFCHGLKNELRRVWGLRAVIVGLMVFFAWVFRNNFTMRSGDAEEDAYYSV